MSRRAIFAIALVVALIGGRLLVSRGLHPLAAAHANAGLAASSSLGTNPAPAVTEANAAPAPVNLDPVKGDAGNELPAPLVRESAHESHSAARGPVAAESVDGVGDIDPHKAFGSKNAPIIVEVFSDYQCPACKTLFMTTNRQLMENYVSTGKVYLIHRDFPLPMHAYSRVAARYARAAADLGKIEPVEKALFENQDKWEQNGDVDGTLAAALSTADMTRVRALVKAGTLEPLIDKDVQLGQIYRVNQTPTTVFHSKGQTYPYSGTMNYDILHQFLDQLLNQK